MLARLPPQGRSYVLGGPHVGSKNRRPSVELIEHWIKQGFGQGKGANYVPWSFIRDVPSQGNSNGLHSQTTGRVHHYLSRGERDLHLIAEYSDVVDIREQYALLPWNEMQAVAAKVGIKHPMIRATTTPSVLTTDLVITVARPDGRQEIAVAVKPRKALEDPRTIEKLWLERFYWMSRGIEWILHVSEEGTPALLAQNLGFFEGALRHAPQVKACPVSPSQFARMFERYWTPERSLNNICKLACDELDLSDIGDGVRQLGAAVWQKQSRIVLGIAPIHHNSSVGLTARGD